MTSLRAVTLFAAFALALATLAHAGAARANPMDTYGLGSRSSALGGAVTADVDDFSANYYNPAGIVRDGRLHVGLGWFGAAHDLSLNDLSSSVDPVSGLVIGLNVPGRVGDVRFGFGLGLHLNDQHVSRTRTLPRARPRWELYDNRPHRTYLATHVAIQPVEWLRIGGGISFLSYSANTLRIRGTINYAQPSRSALEHELEGELITIRYPQVGIQIGPFENLNFGVTYRGEFALDNRLVAEVGTEGGGGPNSATILAGDLAINGYFYLLSQSVNAYVPHQIAFGASYTPIPEVRVSVDMTWLMWSLYQSPIGRSQVILDISVPPELADTIQVPERIPELSPIPARFEDRVVPRLGVEVSPYRNEQLAVQARAGYFYEASPAPLQTTRLTNLVDTDRHTWSLGVGLDLLDLRPLLPGFLSLDAHFAYSWLPSRLIIKDSPIDPVGDYVAQGHIFTGGITMEAGFE
jgi:long-chain fatty acid transport protein